LQAAIGNDFQLQAIGSGSELLTNLRIGQVIFNVLGVMALLMGGFIISTRSALLSLKDGAIWYAARGRRKTQHNYGCDPC